MRTTTEIKNLHALEVKYYPRTNNSCAWVVIISKRFKQRIMINSDYLFDSPSEIAIKYLMHDGFNIVEKCEFGKTDIILSDTFKPLR